MELKQELFVSADGYRFCERVVTARLERYFIRSRVYIFKLKTAFAGIVLCRRLSNPTKLDTNHGRPMFAGEAYPPANRDRLYCFGQVSRRKKQHTEWNEQSGRVPHGI